MNRPAIRHDMTLLEGLYVHEAKFEFAKKLIAQPRTIDNAMEFGGITSVYVDDRLAPDDWYPDID